MLRSGGGTCLPTCHGKPHLVVLRCSEWSASLLASTFTPEDACRRAVCKRVGLQMGMDQYVLVPFLVGWTSIYQLFWCSPGVQGFDTLPNQLEIVESLLENQVGQIFLTFFDFGFWMPGSLVSPRSRSRRCGVGSGCPVFFAQSRGWVALQHPKGPEPPEFLRCL